MVENHAKSLDSHDCMHMYMFGCLVNGVCMCGLAVVLAFWSTTAESI